MTTFTGKDIFRRPVCAVMDQTGTVILQRMGKLIGGENLSLDAASATALAEWIKAQQAEAGKSPGG